MNILVLGLPRNGKTLYTQEKLIEELRLGKRCIITNIAVEKFPWVTAKHETRRGLISYLEEKYESDFNCRERIFRIDESAMKHFYLYRALSRKQIQLLTDRGLHLVGYREVTLVDGVMAENEFLLHKELKLFVADHETRLDKNGKKIIVSFNPALVNVSGGHVNAADECWRFWAARSWQSTSEADVWYNAQHGKLGDDNFFITHRDNDIDSVIVERCQESHLVTHRGKLRLGRFRKPNDFEVAVYNGRPMPSKDPRKFTFSLDAAGLAQTYDTSGGVGISGRGQADTGSRLSGLPFWMLPAACVVGLIVVLYGWHVGVGWIHNKLSGLKHPVTASHSLPAVGPVHSLVSDAVRSRDSGPVVSPPVLGDTADDTNSVVCTGFSLLFGDVVVFLSDGSSAYASDGEVQQVTPHWVTAFGRRYRVVVGRSVAVERVSGEVASAGGLASRDDSADWGQVSPPAPVNQVDILPSVNSEASDLAPAPRLNGFSGSAFSSSRGQVQSSLGASGGASSVSD